jgi:minor histocompatibility antigen H13
MGCGGAALVKEVFVLSPVARNVDKQKFDLFEHKFFGGKVQVSPLDPLMLAISLVIVGAYYFTKNWILNNVLAIVFCLQAIQFIFLGKFKNGFVLLTGLFFYDIFFVFGTDVMLTVAKSIDAPIKLLFPKDWSTEEPQFSLLGLGDIVLPGIFIAMCLRFDIT